MARYGRQKKVKRKRWKAYSTKHPEKYQIKEFVRVSNKFSHTKKIKLKADKK